MAEYETFMVDELDDSGEKLKLNILQEELIENLKVQEIKLI